jgi:hypothetical protein
MVVSGVGTAQTADAHPRAITIAGISFFNGLFLLNICFFRSLWIFIGATGAFNQQLLQFTAVRLKVEQNQLVGMVL